MLAIEMGSFDDQARKRLKVWMAANPSVTLTALGQAAGYNQPWATRFLVKGEFELGFPNPLWHTRSQCHGHTGGVKPDRSQGISN